MARLNTWQSMASRPAQGPPASQDVPNAHATLYRLTVLCPQSSHPLTSRYSNVPIELQLKGLTATKRHMPNANGVAGSEQLPTLNLAILS